MEGTIVFEIVLNFLVRNYFTSMQKYHELYECEFEMDYLLIIPTHSCESVKNFFHAAAIKVLFLLYIILEVFYFGTKSTHLEKKISKCVMKVDFFYYRDTYCVLKNMYKSQIMGVDFYS